MTRLVLRKEENVDWYVIEKDVPGGEDERRISHGDVEGPFVEMLRVVSAIRKSRSFRAKRLAVEFYDSDPSCVGIYRPRGDGKLTYLAPRAVAEDLVQQILEEQARLQRESNGKVHCTRCGAVRILCSMGSPTACGSSCCPDPLFDVMAEQGRMDEMYNQTCLGYTEGAEFILGLLSKEIDRRGQVSSVDENPRGVVRDVAVVRRALSEIHKAALRELRESDRYKESGK